MCPNKFVSNILIKFSESISSMGPVKPVPALLIRISIFFSLSVMYFTTLFKSDDFVISQDIKLYYLGVLYFLEFLHVP